jgi:hypothetical protein
MDSVYLRKNNMDFLELNKFSELHNGRDIFFCKTDFLLSDLKDIGGLNNDVILISGNSDYPITDEYLKILPNNVIRWFGQNILSNHEIFEPIPLGIENKIDSFRPGHGISYYERVNEKENLLGRNSNLIPTKKIYANFKVDTNYNHRIVVRDICKKSNHIDWEEPNLTLNEFFDKILDYEMVVCPIGNGLDTHRLWEVLYSNRIPITVKVGNFKIYEMYEKFPIILLDNINELGDENILSVKYQKIKEKKFDRTLLDFDFWKNKILNIDK